MRSVAGTELNAGKDQKEDKRGYRWHYRSPIHRPNQSHNAKEFAGAVAGDPPTALSTVFLPSTTP